MKRVIIESPYRASNRRQLKKNVDYARRAMHDSLMRGEAPIASHLIYTQPGVLDDNIPEERGLGIRCGFAWSSVAEVHAFYTDRGWSEGMLKAYEFCIKMNKPYELRSIPKPTVHFP